MARKQMTNDEISADDAHREVLNDVMHAPSPTNDLIGRTSSIPQVAALQDIMRGIESCPDVTPDDEIDLRAVKRQAMASAVAFKRNLAVLMKLAKQ